MSSGKRKHAFRRAALLAFLAVAAYAVYDLYASNNLPELDNYVVEKSGLPAAFDGFTIVHLSDLHEKYFGRNGDAVIGLVREAKPDIIAVTGDFIHSVEGLAFLEDTCQALAAIAPVYTVTGNHEWSVEWDESRQDHPSFIGRMHDIYDRCGVTYLDSAFVPLSREGESIVLVGICDPNGPDYAPNSAKMAEKIAASPENGLFSLVLSHRYDSFEDYVAAGFDVVMAGHAHGGVVRLPFTDGLIGPDREWFPRRTGGVYREGATTMVVSRGLGDTYVPRFGNRPQVVKITLRSAGG